MSVMERRLQLLLDNERCARVEAEARKSARSIAAAIREAVDVRFDLDAEDAQRREAAGRFLEMAPQTGDEPPGDEWTRVEAAAEDELAAEGRVSGTRLTGVLRQLQVRRSAR